MSMHDRRCIVAPAHACAPQRAVPHSPPAPRRPRSSRAVVAFLIATLAASAARANVNGTIKTKDGRTLAGTIRWQPASKVYRVTIPPNNITIEVPPDQVAENGVAVPKPAGLDEAVQKLREGKAADAIPALEKIAADYEMLRWDVTACRYLAEAFLAKKDSAKAVSWCEKAIASSPSAAWSGDMAPFHWEALRLEKKEATLNKVLGQAIAQGSRDDAARAQVKRGDIDMDKGNFKDALVNGYLRTIVLFQQVKTVQPEALYKAVVCFERLNQPGHAEKMRKKLLADFPQSSYAAKLRSGT